MSSQYAIRPSQLSKSLDLFSHSGSSVFVWGPPGIGKSAIIKQWSEDQGREFIDIRLSQVEPTDLRGVPVPVDVDLGNGKTTKRVVWSIPAILPTDPDSRAVIFLDEFNSAMPIVQAACYQLVLDRKLGEYEVPKGCVIIAAGNRETDKGVTFRMATPIANRFVHLELESNFDDWQQHAMIQGYHPQVVGYLSHFKAQLFNFNPSSATRGWQSPRSWQFLSDNLYAMEEVGGVPRELALRVAIGCVGEIANEFMAHRELTDKLPALDDILDGRVKEVAMLKDPKNAALNYSLATSICYHLRELLKEAKEKQAAGDDTVWKKFVKQTNNFLYFTMNSCTTEVCIMIARLGLTTFGLPLSHKEIVAFVDFRKEYSKYIMN